MKTFYAQRTTSTMDLARTLIADKGLSEPFAVMCRVQTAGRGRGGSRWTQATELGLTEAQLTDANRVEEAPDFVSGVRRGKVFGPTTFVIPADRIGIPLSWLSLAVGCAVTDALWRARSRVANMLGFSKFMALQDSSEARLKWPNDVWAWPVRQVQQGHPLAPKKLAGILCESSFRADSLQFVCIGLGLNILGAPEEVSHAGSIAEMWGINVSELNDELKQCLTEIIAAEVVRELVDYVQTERSAEQLRHLTLERSLPLGTSFSVNKGEHTGAFRGLSADGGLLIEGHPEPVIAADVSLPTPFARICLDFGNSQIHWRSECGERITLGQSDWSNFDRKTTADQRLFAKTDLVQNILKSVEGASRVQLVWSAVANAAHSTKLIESLESVLVSQDIAGREILLSPLNADAVLRDAGLESDYAPEQMGVDRALQAWVASRAAQETQSAVAVLSVGTAFTGIIISADNRIIESFILPGPAMSLRALHEKTARLPSVTLPQHLPELIDTAPYSTPISMLRGLALQFCSLVEYVTRAYSIGKIILTGGGAQACLQNLNNSLKSIVSLEPELVLAAMSLFAAQSKNSRFNMLQSDEGSPDGLPEKVLQSMLRARLSRRRVQRVTLDRKYFRRLGGRLEHVGVGLRLDRHLGEKFKFHTRDIWQQRVDIGEILIEQNSPKNHTTDEAPSTLISVKSTYVLKQGDQIWLFHPPEYEPDMMTDIEVVYDDGDAAVFCKPGNLVVHAAGLYGKNTFIEIAKKMGYANAAPVHRIDRETSGILVCARSTPLRRDLSLSFRDSSVKKMYLAVTKGQRPLPHEFRVALPIGPAVNSRIRLKLWHNPDEGLDALTHCVRLASWEDYSLFACMPQTGRTNQIRVHLAAVGHWIVGDKMYHPDEDAFLQFYEEGYIPAVAEKVLLPRHWLHNTAIQFLSKPESDLGRAPVIAPLTEDLLTHGPTIELLRRAGLPLEPQNQKTAFAELFRRMMSIDFSGTPEMNHE